MPSARKRPRWDRSSSTKIAVDVDHVGITAPLGKRRVKEIVRAVCERERVKHAMISVTFVTNRAIAAMNKKYLEHAGATDIITFELSHPATEETTAETNRVVMGDMYIAPAVARANAEAHRIPIREEMIRLVVHGTLHVLGYTHPEGDTRTRSPMWRRQERLVEEQLDVFDR